MFDWAEYLQFLIVLIAIIDVPGNIPVFLQQTTRMTNVERRLTAVYSGIATFLVLVVFAFLGELVLKSFGISLADFKILGGLVILFFSLEMLGLIKLSSAGTDDCQMNRPLQIAIFPLAIPLFAGPGAISVVLVYAHHDFQSSHDLIVAALVLGVSVAVALGMLAASFLSYFIGPTVQLVMNRLLGMLVGALGIEFIATGVLEVISRGDL